ncbi:unnamed protein product [Polarella glacialis]|uniref:MORN repeat-containing protein 5 n=1 Tax=Polarella glacialis TaxID=89957 RepID=A0A813D940_POLGL|nr:unnamed protein product [Polarella glacialis]
MAGVEAAKDSNGGLFSIFGAMCCKVGADNGEEVDPAMAVPCFSEETVTRKALESSTQDLDLVEREEVEVEGAAMYTGQWFGQMRYGKGVLIRPDGQTYSGDFVDNRAHGVGRFTAANGNTYEGEWQQDRAHGTGKYLHIDGSTYEGQWLQDEKSGKGIENWADGARL